MNDETTPRQSPARISGVRFSWPESKRFVILAGGVLALAGATRVWEGLQHHQVLHLPDPLSGISFRYLLLGIGAAELLTAWLCLFTRRQRLSLWLLVWLVFDSLVYRAGLWSMGWPHPWVFVGGLADLLHVSPLWADGLLLVLDLCLLAGGAKLLLTRQEKLEPGYLKVTCSMCGGRTAFSPQWANQVISCPHCGAAMTLRPALVRTDGEHA